MFSIPGTAESEVPTAFGSVAVARCALTGSISGGTLRRLRRGLIRRGHRQMERDGAGLRTELAPYRGERLAALLAGSDDRRLVPLPCALGRRQCRQRHR